MNFFLPQHAQELVLLRLATAQRTEKQDARDRDPCRRASPPGSLFIADEKKRVVHPRVTCSARGDRAGQKKGLNKICVLAQRERAVGNPRNALLASYASYYRA